MLTNYQLCAQRIGDELLIAYNDGQGTEWCYLFKKCMVNQLFTFQKVGYRSVVRTTSDTQGIKTDPSIVWLNSVGSDNLGPVGVKNHGFVGGNHYWMENGTTKTAVCAAFSIYADNTAITSDATTMCGRVTIQVQNTVFDPSAETAEDPLQASLSTPLFNEYVEYRIWKNSIQLAVKHVYSGGVGQQISRYYGMQSVFLGESGVMTPGGAYSDFTPTANVTHFELAPAGLDYSGFHRYIEKSDNGYQSAYLRPTGIGNHQLLTANAFAYIREGGKSYHSMIFHQALSSGVVRGQLVNITQGLEYNWSGVYTWSRPAAVGVALPVDTADVLVYPGVIDGDDALYIDTKDAWTGTVQIPGLSQWQGMLFVQQDSGISVSRSGDTLSVTATSAASAIIRNRIPGDVNGDGVIDVDDVNAVTAMILGLQEIDLVADLNGDGVVDTDDLNLLINIILNQ